jgi:hypothetical protein
MADTEKFLENRVLHKLKIIIQSMGLLSAKKQAASPSICPYTKTVE